MIVSSFIIQANVITIVNYNRKTFIVQATGQKRLQKRRRKKVFQSFPRFWKKVEIGTGENRHILNF
jgi:hypothetical protein